MYIIGQERQLIRLIFLHAAVKVCVCGVCVGCVGCVGCVLSPIIVGLEIVVL